jgi:hypothetical protein
VREHEQDDHDDRYAHQPKNDRHDNTPLSSLSYPVNSHSTALFPFLSQDLSERDAGRDGDISILSDRRGPSVELRR